MEKKDKFIAAIKVNEGIIYKIASVYANDAEDKKDLVQEIIYNLWKSYDTFDGRSAFSTWMYRVAMNVAIWHLKVAKRKLLTTPMYPGADFAEPPANDYEEKLKIFRQHLNNLNPVDKGIVLLYLENKNYAEIAEITGITATNVGTRLSRIKEKLKTQIAKQL